MDRERRRESYLAQAAADAHILAAVDTDIALNSV